MKNLKKFGEVSEGGASSLTDNGVKRGPYDSKDSKHPEKGNLFIVTAQSFDPKTGEPVGKSRDEEIDVVGNKLFHGCKTILDIHDKYEEFWNHMNDHPKELVFVSKITWKGL